jgi:hypothetical protein
MGMLSASSMSHEVQRLMDEVLENVPSAKTYIADDFVFTSTFEQQLAALAGDFSAALSMI